MELSIGNSSTNFKRFKKLCSYVVFSALQFSAFFSVAQAPGGVTGNLRGWYKAESGVTLTGGVVSGWADQGTLGNNGTQAVAARRPTQTAGVINYNTALTFDGQDDYVNIPDLVAAATTGISTFAVARQTATNRDIYGCVLVGQTDDTGSSGGYGLTSRAAGNNNFGFFIRDFFVNAVGYNTTLSDPSLMTGIWNGTTVNNVQYFQDGTSRGTDPYTPGSIGDNGSSYIGSGVGTTGTDYCFYGNIAEVVVYNTGLPVTSVNRIESYLSLKYGITLGSNYVNSAGTNLFTTAAPYNNDIIGIGRDDGSLLNQKQSRTNDDSCRVFINTLAATNAANAGTFSSNNQFLVLGHDNQRLSGQFTEKPASVFSRIRREWKITNTGFSGTFSFAIRLNSIANQASLNGAHLRLLVDADGNFADATVYNPSITFASGVILVSGITTAQVPINATSYITIGSDNSNSPLPIELLSFEALLCDNDNVCLEWKTATETNNDHFEVTRSADGSNWQMVSTVKGSGNSYQPRTYQTRDGFPLTGTSYYRLKQVDFDGTSSFSPIVALNNEINYSRELRSIPNPANDEATIPGFRAADLQVFNILGEKIDPILISEGVGEKQVHINTAGLPDGIYFVSTTNTLVDPGRRVIRIVVKHH